MTCKNVNDVMRTKLPEHFKYTEIDHVGGMDDQYAFKKLSLRRFPKPDKRKGEEEKFWNKFQVWWKAGVEQCGSWFRPKATVMMTEPYPTVSYSSERVCSCHECTLLSLLTP